ncbi:uncharacterized protein [Setaria viridis]|uniref:uncharacterized protein n=1 Tax=Setaria viridis TaxID=4556 RepID=UPI003B3B00BD
MSPLEALYRRKCRTPLMWFEVGERTLFGPATIKEVEENVSKVIKRIGDLAYKVALPGSMAGVHPVFHVSQLRKCLIVPKEEVHTEALDLQDTLEYAEYPVKILD